MNRILIVEDEIRIARLLTSHIQAVWGKELIELAHRSQLQATKDYLASNTIDVLFLDINLNGDDGYELLRERKQAFQTIIVSAYTDRAIDAFNLGVIDFLGKPFNRERIALAYSRLKEWQGQVGRAFIAVKTKRGFVPIRVSSLRYIKADGHYAYLYQQSGKKFLCDKSLDSLENELPNNFLRIHRSWIVNLDCVKKIQSFPGGKHQAVLDDQSTVPMSRTRYRNFRNHFG